MSAYLSELSPTDESGVHYCPECEQKVYECRTPAEFVEHGNLGHCVSIPEGFAPMNAFLEQRGHPSRKSIEELQKRKFDIQQWWALVVALQPEFAQEALAEVERIFHPQ